MQLSLPLWLGELTNMECVALDTINFPVIQSTDLHANNKHTLQREDIYLLQTDHLTFKVPSTPNSKKWKPL